MLKVANWNINGGYLIKNNYTTNNFKYFIDEIKKLKPDIVFIQEGHISSTYSQIEVLSKELNLKYYTCQKLGDSHIEEGNELCIFILSKFKLENIEFKEIKIPYFEKYNETFKRVIKSNLHKKGFLKAEIKYNNKKLNLICSHGHALYLFEKSLDDFPKQKEESVNYVLNNSDNLVFGVDMNYDKLSEIKQINNKCIFIFKEEKTYRNKENDHIVVGNNLKILNKNINYCTNDHPLMYVDLDIK
jgi:hypothetical protein